MILYGKLVRLTGIEERDQIVLNRLMNDPTAEVGIESAFWPVSMAQQEQWFHSSLENLDCRRLAIREQEEDDILGIVSIYKMDFKNRKFGTGIKLVGGGRGKGFAFDAMITLLHFMFNEMNFHRAWTLILDTNLPSKRLFEKIGFIREGILRKSAFKTGVYHNQFVYGLLREDFFENAPKLDLYSNRVV